MTELGVKNELKNVDMDMAAEQMFVLPLPPDSAKRWSTEFDGEVRFGKDWADEVTQIGNHIVTDISCVHEHTCGLASAWLFVFA